jgi:hypothetical protein
MAASSPGEPEWMRWHEPETNVQAKTPSRLLGVFAFVSAKQLSLDVDGLHDVSLDGYANSFKDIGSNR